MTEGENTLFLLDLSSYAIFEQLQIEEALLRVDTRNWCIINHGSTPAIVMGISGKIDALVDRDKWNANPVPIIKRFSGGGTVYVDHNTLFITLLGNKTLFDEECFPAQLMEWSAQFYAPLFANQGFALRENDYVLGDKKFGGNAQYLLKNRWLHPLNRLLSAATRLGAARA